MKDKKQDASGYKSTLGDVSYDPSHAGQEPVDFGAAISEIENTKPGILIGKAATLQPGTPLTEEGLRGVSLTAISHPGPQPTPEEERDGIESPPLSEAALETLEVEIDSPVAGYDLVEDKEGAVLLCGLIIHRTVEALNKAHNEHTVSWDANRDSVVAGVRRVLENPNETPEQNHNAWMAYKLVQGWKYGITKDEKAKTHPCLVLYDELRPIQKAKDMIFLAIVRAFFGL